MSSRNRKVGAGDQQDLLQETELHSNGDPQSLVLYLLTNQLNLQSILSSGLVLPRNGFGKYYRDLLEFTGSEIPLGAAFDDLSVEAVTSETDITLFPVAVEMPSEIAAATVERSGGWRVLRGPAALPDAPRIHFRSDHDRQEFEVRPYENVIYKPELIVTPHLFDGSLSTPLIESLMGHQPKIEGPSPEDFDAAERLAGALCLGTVAAAASRELAETISAVWSGKPHEIEVDGEAVEMSGLTLATVEEGVDSDSTTVLLLSNAMRCAASLKAQELPGPTAWIAHMRDQMPATAHARDDALDELARLLDIMAKVQDGEIAFNDVTEHMSQALQCIGGTSLGLSNARPPALLIPGTAAHLVGSMLIGAAHGHRVLGHDFRPTTAEPLYSQVKVELLRHRVSGRKLALSNRNGALLEGESGTLTLVVDDAPVLQTAPDVRVVLRDPDRVARLQTVLVEALADCGLARFAYSEYRLPITQPMSVACDGDWIVVRGPANATTTECIDIDPLLTYLETAHPEDVRALSDSFAQRL